MLVAEVGKFSEACHPGRLGRAGLAGVRAGMDSFARSVSTDVHLDGVGEELLQGHAPVCGNGLRAAERRVGKLNRGLHVRKLGTPLPNQRVQQHENTDEDSRQQSRIPNAPDLRPGQERER